MNDRKMTAYLCTILLAESSSEGRGFRLWLANKGREEVTRNDVLRYVVLVAGDLLIKQGVYPIGHAYIDTIFTSFDIAKAVDYICVHHGLEV
jgi:hypothetical protein